MPEPDDEFWEQFDTHEMIMEATVWVLAEEGYRGLTLRKVADRTGKNRGLVHYYFDSKEDLLQSLLDHIFDGTKRLMEIDEQNDPHNKLWTVLEFRAYGPGGQDENGRHYYLAINQLQALAAHDSVIRERFTRNYNYLVELTAGIIKDGIEDGTYRPIDPDKTAVSLLVAIDGARTQDLTLDVDTVRETVLESIAQFESEILMASEGVS